MFPGLRRYRRYEVLRVRRRARRPRRWERRRRRRPGFILMVLARCGDMTVRLTLLERRLRRRVVRRVLARVRLRARVRRDLVRCVALRARRRVLWATCFLAFARRIPFSAARRRAALERRVFPGRPSLPARLRAAQYRLSAAGWPRRRAFFCFAIDMLPRARR